MGVENVVRARERVLVRIVRMTPHSVRIIGPNKATELRNISRLPPGIRDAIKQQQHEVICEAVLTRDGRWQIRDLNAL